MITTNEVLDLVALLEPKDENPNVMDKDEYAALVRAVREKGFLQPVLVRQLRNGNGDDAGYEDTWEIVDGVHRSRAARECGFERVPCVVAQDMTDDQAKVLRIAMNKLRGQLDLSIVGKAFVALAESGLGVDELTSTGFSEAEIENLIRATQQSVDDIMDQPTESADPNDEPVEVNKPFLLELTFTSREQLDTVKKALKHAAGKGRDMSDGLLRLIGHV